MTVDEAIQYTEQKIADEGYQCPYDYPQLLTWLKEWKQQQIQISKVAEEETFFNTPLITRTGFDKLDAATGGYYPTLITVGGKAKSGRTSFCYQLADQILSTNSDVYIVYVSYKEAPDELFPKTIARLTKLAQLQGKSKEQPMTQDMVMLGELTKTATQLLYTLKDQTNNLSCYKGNRKKDHINEVLRKVHWHQAETRCFKSHISKFVVIIDSLQAIPATQPNLNSKEDMEQKIAAIHDFIRSTHSLVIAVTDNHSVPVSWRLEEHERTPKLRWINITCNNNPHGECFSVPMQYYPVYGLFREIDD